MKTTTITRQSRPVTFHDYTADDVVDKLDRVIELLEWMLLEKTTQQ